MVQKKSKYGYNRGSTFCHRCRYKSVKETGKIYKFLFGNGHDEENQTGVSENLEKHLPDGGMQHNKHYEHVYEIYSLNKRKRWTLPSAIIDVIDSRELDDSDFRVVMHERSSVPFRFAWYTRNSEIKASTLSYHDSKYTVHHMYPNPKSRVSSLTDLKLNCHRNHDGAKPNVRASDTTKPSRKCHTRGIQRMQTPDPENDNIRYWRRNEYYFRDVMEGAYHKIMEPEVRYEIHYPDIFNRYCQCQRHHGHGMRFPPSTDKPLRRWKTKGCRAKPSMQEHFKGIDHLEKRLLTSDYIKEMDEDTNVWIASEINDDMLQGKGYSQVEREALTIADFCVGLTRPSDKIKRISKLRSSNIEKRRNPCNRTKPFTVNGTPIEKCYGKGNIVYIENTEHVRREDEQVQHASISSADDIKDGVAGNDVTGIDMVTLSRSDIEFERQFCSCLITKKSVQNMIDTCTDYDVLVSNCVPQQLCITIQVETAIARVILWQRSGWSPCLEQAEYWIKVQFECDGTVDEMTCDDVKSKLYEKDDAIFSLHQIASIVKREAANWSLVTNRQRHKENVQPIGHLTTAVADPSFDVKTVHEAYAHLLTEEDDILQSFEFVNIIPTLPEKGTCETCLSESDDTPADGCTLLPCQHYFCIDCWRQHIIIKIKEGANGIPCQAFNCKEFIDDVMVRTLVSCNLTNQWIKRKKERMLESQSWQWCPTASCDKVATVTSASSRFSGDNIPVLCGCDRVWCFSCQHDAHWPATCDQYLNYSKTLSQNAEPRYYYVDVKRCPKCKHPIEKNGGCPQMTCRCSYGFCWECLRDRSSHVDGVECRERATSLITMTLDDTEYLHMRLYRKCIEHRYKWKKTFSKRAIEQQIEVFGILAAYRTQMKNSKTKQVKFMPEESTDQSVHAELRSSLVFLREVHLLLENVFVMLSYASRRLRPNRTLLDHIDFCIYRMEHILNKSWLCREDLRRVSRLRTSIEGSLRVLPYLSSFIQREIRATKQRGGKLSVNSANSA